MIKMNKLEPLWIEEYLLKLLGSKNQFINGKEQSKPYILKLNLVNIRWRVLKEL